MTVAFFSLFGFIFMITQYFQFVRDVAGQAFVDGLGLTSKVLAGVARAGALAALALLPARAAAATAPDLDEAKRDEAERDDAVATPWPTPSSGARTPTEPTIDRRVDPLHLPPLAGDLHADRLEP